MVEVRANLVGDSWVTEGGGGYADDVNPSDTSDVVAQIPRFDARQAEAAVQAAADAFPGWRATSSVVRGEILRRAGGQLRAEAPTIADLLRREAGKPRSDAMGEVLKSADFLEYYGGLGRAAYGEVLPDARPGCVAQTRREPLGVVVAITPWNDPLLTPVRKLGPALIAGNTVVLKPASSTPIVSQELARVCVDSGLPAGVLNVVTGDSSIVGPVLTGAEPVKAVTFTGSTLVGQSLRAELSGHGTRVQTEMGGKNAVIVMPDADLNLAAETIVAAGFGGVGQRCTATSRVIVHSAIRGAFVEALLSAMEANLVVGPTDTDGVTFGPVISETQMDSVLAAVDGARRGGGDVLRGGHRLVDRPLDGGYFVAPTVIEVDTDAPLWRDEVFGPVLALTGVENLDEAIDIINASAYGLSAGIFTQDLGAAYKFADLVDAGQIAVNVPTSGWDVHLPFGGFKDSGSLFKEQGTVALDFYTKMKTIAMRAN